LLDEFPVASSPAIPDDPLAGVREGILRDKIREWGGELEQARHFIDNHQFGEAVAAGDKMLADNDLVVPPDYVRSQLISMSIEFPELAAAFDNRNQAPKEYARMLRKAHNRIVASAKTMIDRDVSADRAAVAAAVRGTSTKEYKEPTPKYGDMDEATFTREKAKFGI
jgi:hypothetical protein